MNALTRGGMPYNTDMQNTPYIRLNEKPTMQGSWPKMYGEGGNMNNQNSNNMYNGNFNGMPPMMGGQYQDQNTVHRMNMGGGPHYMQGGMHSGQYPGMPPMMGGMYQDRNTVKPMFAGGGSLTRGFGPYGSLTSNQQLNPMNQMMDYSQQAYMGGGRHSRLGPEEAYNISQGYGSGSHQVRTNHMPGQQFRTTRHF